MKALRKGGFKGLEVKTTFLFRASEIRHHCYSIEEFIEYAYGQSNYHFSSMDFDIVSEDTLLWFISVDYDSEVRVSTNTKSLLEKVVGLLENTSLDESEKDVPISVTLIERQDNSVTINGNSNVVANNHSIVTDKQEESKSKFSGWLQGVFQGILANLIWWILGTVAAALLMWAISKGYLSR